MDTYPTPVYIRHFENPTETSLLQWLEKHEEKDIDIAFIGTPSGDNKSHAHLLVLNRNNIDRYDPAKPHPFQMGTRGRVLNMEFNKIDKQVEDVFDKRPQEPFDCGPQDGMMHDTMCVAWCFLFMLLTMFNPENTAGAIAKKILELKANDVNFIRRFHTMLDYMIPSRIVENLYTQLIHQIDFAITDASDSDSE